jgi:acyl-CoA synthetase (AMP-forming)/AMP-acid ligase II
MEKTRNLTVAGLCLASAEKYGKRIAFEIYRQGKICGLTSYRLLGIRQRQFALLLDSLGVQAGSRVLLLSENRPEWAAACFGIALAGAVCVAAAPDSPPEILDHICAHAGLSAICVSRRHAAAFVGAEKRSPINQLIPVIIIDSIAPAEPGQPTSPCPAEQAFISVSINGIGKELPLKEAKNMAYFPVLRPDDPAAVFYSGGGAETVRETTVSNRALIERAFSGGVKLFPRDRLLSTISLANSFELSRGLLRAAAAGALTVYPDEELQPQQLIAAAGALKPTVILAQPGLVMEFRSTFIDPLLKADPFYRHALTKTLAYRRAGRKLLFALGRLIRCLEIDGSLPDEIKNFLNKIKFPTT